MSITHTDPPVACEPCYDLLGVGFGPANVAVSAALVEKWRSNEPTNLTSACFIEKHPHFSWHPGMLLPGSQMQISFLKDLVTLRNPTSPLSFLSYLHAHDRLLPFINRSSFTPTRREFFDYLSWASERVQEPLSGGRGVKVHFSEEVVALEDGPVVDGTSTVRLVSKKSDGSTITRLGKNIIISPGGVARIPESIALLLPHPRILHTSSYVESIDRVLSDLKSIALERPLRIAVLGGGQSAAEVFLNVKSRLSELPRGRDATTPHTLDMIFRRGCLKPSDDTAFSNEIFDPASTDFMFGLPDTVSRMKVRAEYSNTNYCVVNPRTLDQVYEALYEQKVGFACRARPGPSEQLHTIAKLQPYQMLIETQIVSANEDPNLASSPVTSDYLGLQFEDLHTPTTRSTLRKIKEYTGSKQHGPDIVLTLQNALTGAITESRYDAILLGTGYERDTWKKLIKTSRLLSERFGVGLDSKLSNIMLVPEHELQALSEQAKGSTTKGPDYTAPTSLSPLTIPLPASPLNSNEGSPLSESDFSAYSPSIENDSSANQSGATTPPTPHSVHFPPDLASPKTLTKANHDETILIPISRAYRLIETNSQDRSPGVSKTAGIYLQGCTETTHGLSDTLLSVVGVRAGEVVDDLFARA